ncbi:MAG TPA: hypothetical protein VD859_03625 [Nocardioides sp.]|nr:hypothetical protein [Nocardioides sp.]
MSTNVLTDTPTKVQGRLWFAVDAVITGVNAVAYLAAASVLVDLFDGEQSTYRWVGGFLAVYAVLVAAYAWSTAAARTGWAVVVANEAWVVGSVVVAAVGAFDLNALGRTWVVAQAVVVGAFALLQARSLRAGA